MSLSDKPQASSADQKYIDGVIKHGHKVMMVADRVDEPTGDPCFAYSTGGFESYGAPEIIVSGLDLDLMHSMIDNFMAGWKSGDRPVPGEMLSDFLEGYPVTCIPAEPKTVRTHTCWTDWYYERKQFPLWQMVWPGARSGLFPWDDPSVGDLQENLTGKSWDKAWAALKSAK